MGGSEAPQSSSTPYYTSAEFTGFAENYGPDANKLQKVTERGGRYYNIKGEDVTDIFSAFQGWMRENTKAAQQRDQYIQLKKDKPGRAATLIAPYTPQKANTILGQPSTTNTVLG